MLLGTMEDTKFTKQDTYILYIDFKNTFGSIYHIRLFIIRNLLEAIELVGYIYTNTTTPFVGLAL
jgi:hypothetical protein